MSLGICSNNFGGAIVANGSYCSILTWTSGYANAQFGCTLINNARYIFTTGGTTTGNVNIQEFAANGVWVTLADVATIPLSAATVYSGAITGTFHGLRFLVSALAVSTILYAELRGTVTS